MQNSKIFNPKKFNNFINEIRDSNDNLIFVGDINSDNHLTLKDHIDSKKTSLY